MLRVKNRLNNLKKEIYKLFSFLLLIFLSTHSSFSQKGMKGSKNFKKNGTFSSGKNNHYSKKGMMMSKKRKQGYKQKGMGRHKKGGVTGDVFVGKRKSKYGYTNNRYRDKKNYRYRTRKHRKRGYSVGRRKYNNPSTYSENMRKYMKRRQKHKANRTRKVMGTRG